MDPLQGQLSFLSALAGHSLLNSQYTAVSGGGINEVYRIAAPDGRAYCCKLNSATKFPHLFESEAASLQQLRIYFRTPAVVGWGQKEATQVLLLQWVETTSPTPAFWKRFGKALAAMHAAEGPYFGAAANNYMGAVPQRNEPLMDWASFFSQRRLLPLAKQCLNKNLLGNNEMQQVERICLLLPQLFEPITPRLLHGDLWSGNFLCDTQQMPVLIDPATYFGHPAVDLAMTTLFGGFDTLFYEAYQHYAPLPENHKDQWAVCNLYPLLIHLLLFGDSYLHSIRRILQRFGGAA